MNISNLAYTRVVKKTRFWGNRLLFHFSILYVEKKTLHQAVACPMIFNTASTMTNLSLNSQNRLFSCSGIGLLIRFLVFHPMKISFVKPGACAIIFSTALLVNKFMKQRNKKLKMLYKLLLMQPLFSSYLQRRSTKPEICTLTCKRYHLIDPKYFKIPFFLYRFFISLFHKFKYR